MCATIAEAEPQDVEDSKEVCISIYSLIQLAMACFDVFE
jgi:hypothetical protein